MQTTSGLRKKKGFHVQSCPILQLAQEAHNQLILYQHQSRQDVSPLLGETV